jgi:hypothetical protein
MNLNIYSEGHAGLRAKFFIHESPDYKTVMPIRDFVSYMQMCRSFTSHMSAVCLHNCYAPLHPKLYLTLLQCLFLSLFEGTIRGCLWSWIMGKEVVIFFIICLKWLRWTRKSQSSWLTCRVRIKTRYLEYKVVLLTLTDRLQMITFIQIV